MYINYNNYINFMINILIIFLYHYSKFDIYFSHTGHKLLFQKGTNPKLSIDILATKKRIGITNIITNNSKLKA